MSARNLRPSVWLAVLVAVVLSALGAPRPAGADPAPPADSSSVSASMLSVVDPSSLWRVRSGVVSDCGAADLDESAFTTIDAYERAPLAAPEACFRATIADQWPGQPIALSIGVLYAAAAIYVNGALLATHGDIESGHGARRVHVAYAIPNEARRPDGKLVIAVRARVTPAAYWFRTSRIFEGTEAVGPSPLVEAEVRADDGSSPVLVGRMVVAAVFALLGAFHLVLYRKRRKLTEYLYWALAMLSFSGWMTSVILITASDAPRDLLDHFSALGYAVVVFALAGTWRLFREDPMPRPLRWIVGLNVVLGVPQLLATETFGRVVPYALVMVVLLVGALAILGVTVREAWRANVEARTVLLGMTLNVICFAAQVAAVTLALPNEGLATIAYSGAQIGHVFFALSMAIALANRFSRSLAALDAAHQELGRTYEAAARFVPTDLLEILGHRSIREVRLGDQIAHPMSTLFADVRGFSALAESVGPALTFDIINRYLAFMEPAIHEQKGFILQYLGDGIMALFPRRADDAVRAGIAMHQALARLNSERSGAGEAPLVIGIGVNTGLVMVGTIGGKERLDSGVVGDSVNLASRIEGMTKMYGTALLLGERTVDALDDRSAFALREIDRVVAKGTSNHLSIYEVLDALPDGVRDARSKAAPRYAEALAALRRGAFVEARDKFVALADDHPDDGPAAALAERTRELAAAPPAEWTGATQLLSK